MENILFKWKIQWKHFRKFPAAVLRRKNCDLFFQSLGILICTRSSHSVVRSNSFFFFGQKVVVMATGKHCHRCASRWLTETIGCRTAATRSTAAQEAAQMVRSSRGLTRKKKEVHCPSNFFLFFLKKKKKKTSWTFHETLLIKAFNDKNVRISRLFNGLPDRSVSPFNPMFSFIRWKCGWRFGSTWQCAENYAEIRTYLVGEKLKIIAGQAVHLPQLLFFYLFDDDIFFSCSQKHKHPRHHELFFSPDSRPTVASVINKGPWTDTLMLTRSEGKKMFSWGKCSLQELRILLFVDVTLKNVRADFGGFRQFISKVIKLIEIESTVFL